jgi:hypothetical protein
MKQGLLVRSMFWAAALSLAGGIACSKKGPPADKPAGLPPSPGATPPPQQAPAAAGGQGEGVEVVAAAPDAKQTIGGTIVLPDSHRSMVKKGDTVFLIARRAGGPPGPGSMLAVQRLQAGDFPMPFALSSRDAMVPGTPFEGEINISVRVDKDGDPITRRKGDVMGQASGVRVGNQDVQVVLDTVLDKDVTLGGMGMPPGAAGGALPPGHP